MRKTALLLLLFGALAPPAQAQEKDPEALAERLMEALGGEEAWERTRYIRFNFFGRRLHYWDKWTGRHRLEGETREGDEYLVLHNIDTREGDAWLSGDKLEGEAEQERLEAAYRAWINDTYWLLMPYKLRDPGVHLSYAGAEEIDGRMYDKVKLSFEEGVGVTSGDRYWAYINRDTGLMDRWAYILQSNQEENPQPTVWEWKGWARYGDIMLADVRSAPDGDREARLSDIAVFDDLPDSVFESPEPVKIE